MSDVGCRTSGSRGINFLFMMKVGNIALKIVLFLDFLIEKTLKGRNFF
jgi:hypothetical protein